MPSQSFRYRKIKEADRKWVNDFITEHWGSDKVVVHQTTCYPKELEGFIAYEGNKKVGLVTYLIENNECEIVTLNSLIEKQGVGTKLVKLVEEEVTKNNCRQVWLITTNDNLNAINFYKKLGYELTEIFKDAVEQSRKIKPEIPLVAENGIPIKDELKFVLYLDQI